MDVYTALRLQALRAVKKPDSEAHIRHIHRWYSKNFHTPLHEVAELDPHDVLTAYYESTFEEMEPEERDRELAELLKTPEERAEEARRHDREEAELYIFSRIVEEERKRKEATKKMADVKPEPPPKEPEPLPPNIEIKFVDDDIMEELLNSPPGPIKK